MKLFIYIFIQLIFTFNLIHAQQFWHEQISGTVITLKSVSAVNNNVVWVCGYNGTVLRTTNSGVNWSNANSGGIPGNVSLINIWGINGGSAITAGYAGTNTWVWKTTNAGSNWAQVFTQPNGFINAIAMRQSFPNQGIMIGDPVGSRWSIWKTTDSGSNWDSTGLFLPQAGSETGWNNSLFWSQYPDSSIWFGTNNYRVYHSNNYGQSWGIQSTLAEQNSYAISFWYTSGLTGGSTLYMSNNYGYNWSNITSLGTNMFGGFVTFPVPVENTLNFGYSWYVRNDTKIYRAIGGFNWEVEYTAPSGNYVHISQPRNGFYLWAVRNNGGITRCSCYISGITQISGKVPVTYFLKQNFPNPFNPQTNIDFDIPKKTFVKINVYDPTGRLVTNIINNEYNAGSYRVNWDASGYSSGVYFYSIITEEFVQTKKMMLVK